MSRWRVFVDAEAGNNCPAPSGWNEPQRTCYTRRARVPRAIVFSPLPKTSTGKNQKVILRQQVKSVTAIE